MHTYPRTLISIQALRGQSRPPAARQRPSHRERADRGRQLDDAARERDPPPRSQRQPAHKHLCFFFFFFFFLFCRPLRRLGRLLLRKRAPLEKNTHNNNTKKTHAQSCTTGPTPERRPGHGIIQREIFEALDADIRVPEELVLQEDGLSPRNLRAKAAAMRKPHYGKNDFGIISIRR